MSRHRIFVMEPHIRLCGLESLPSRAIEWPPCTDTHTWHTPADAPAITVVSLPNSELVLVRFGGRSPPQFRHAYDTTPQVSQVYSSPSHTQHRPPLDVYTPGTDTSWTYTRTYLGLSQLRCSRRGRLDGLGYSTCEYRLRINHSEPWIVNMVGALCIHARTKYMHRSFYARSFHALQSDGHAIVPDSASRMIREDC
jgi:hypothetical protein